jgi:TetR/AcrR family transcriptional repressor of nem operon
MGLNVYSLYAEFGSKQGLYEAALDHYARQVVPGYIGSLEEPGANLATIREVLGLFPTFAGTEDEVRGCLICNAATELAPTPDLSHGAMDGYITRLAGAFENALRNAQAEGTVRASLDPLATARFLAGTLLGVFVMIRAQIDRAVVQDTVDGALFVVES